MGRIIVDTGVLWMPAALGRLALDRREAILPAVAYTERARQWTAHGRAIATLDGLLEHNGIRVEAFEVDHGLRFAASLHDEAMWRRFARDAFIAGHMGPDDELWTPNPRDFAELGVPAHQVVAI